MSERSGEVQHDFNGLIQHSFALRIPDELKPQYSRKDISDPRELLSALLTVPAGPNGDGGFRPLSVGEMGGGKLACPHSLIVGGVRADIVGQVLPFLATRAGKPAYPSPLPFEWVRPDYKRLPADSAFEWDGCIPAEIDAYGDVLANDYLVVDAGSPSTPPCPGDPVAVSWLLCQLLAHRRSRLFGWSLMRRIFNVLLPHALLRASPGDQTDDGCPRKDWIVQPALSLFLTNQGRGFRSIFSLSLFVIPVHATDGGRCPCQVAPFDKRSHVYPAVHERRMSGVEIRETIQAGWSVATSPPSRPGFTVSGPLCDYLSALDRSMPARLGVRQTRDGSVPNGVMWDALSFRKSAEAIVLATVLRLVEGPGDHEDPDTTKKLGERVLVALSSSRASSAVVVDEKFEKGELEKSRREGRFPGSLETLMQEIGAPVQLALRKKYRLDRSFFDNPDYAIGVLPANRCVVFTANVCSQKGNLESGLLEAGWLAYMVIGAATATGMMRSIYHEIEQVSGSKPNAIADIEREVVVDLHEIYDLDITWEQYRQRYRLLRDCLGITRDYESLQCKLEALYRESSTRFEDKAQTRLAWLTAAIVFLTLVVIVVTLLVK